MEPQNSTRKAVRSTTVGSLVVGHEEDIQGNRTRTEALASLRSDRLGCAQHPQGSHVCFKLLLR